MDFVQGQNQSSGFSKIKKMTKCKKTGSAGENCDEFPGRISGRLTVSELTRIIKSLIEENIPIVTVEGELSNYVHHTSGHRYFTLKDESSQIRCVMFRWQAQGLDFTPEEGMKLLAVGNVMSSKILAAIILIPGNNTSKPTRIWSC